MRKRIVEFCPLGILCDVVDPKGWVQHNYRWYHLGASFSPSENILNEAGLSRPEIVCIYYWNDKEELTFVQIADKIKEIF